MGLWLLNLQGNAPIHSAGVLWHCHIVPSGTKRHYLRLAMQIRCVPASAAGTAACSRRPTAQVVVPTTLVPVAPSRDLQSLNLDTFNALLRNESLLSRHMVVASAGKGFGAQPKVPASSSVPQTCACGSKAVYRVS